MTSSTDHLLSSAIAARAYDVLNWLLWLPGGSDHLRRNFVGTIGMRSDMRVLELGCGTGLVTRHLVATGADVTAVDGSSAMLDRARRRAPKARFDLADLAQVPADGWGSYDRVVLSFLLHELDPETRVHVLRGASASLAPEAEIGILEWGMPPSERRGAIWSRLVRTIEPAVAHDILDGGLDDAVAATGLRVVRDDPLAGGRARVLTLER